MENFVELKHVFAILLRRWWILVLGALIAGVLGYSVSKIQTPVYAATTTVYVGRPIKSSDLARVDLLLGTQLAPTYADFVRRKPVLQGAMDALNLPGSWQELRSRVQVSAVENTQLLEIRVEATSPQEAQVLADEIARQLILIGPMSSGGAKAEETKEFAQQRLTQLRTNIEEAQTKVNTLEVRIAATLDDPTASDTPIVDLQTEVRTLETLITEWDSTYANLLAFLNTEPSANHLSIVETAEANDTPVRPRVKFNTIIAILVGLFLAMGLSFLIEFLDDTLRPTDAISELLGVVTIGEIRSIKGRSIQEKMIFRQDLFSPASEDYRLLRNKLQVMCADWPRKVIMVTSPTSGELKSITVANLGTVLAKAGLRVIIVDTNLRQPMQHVLFKLSNLSGLTELVYDADQDLDVRLENTEVPNLRVLPAGAFPPPHPSELLGSTRMGELLDRLAKQADIVLCDSAHVVAIADAVMLSSKVDGVILVVEVGKTSRSTAERAVYNLRQGGANLLGAVLSPMPADAVATPRIRATLTSTMNGRSPSDKEQVVEYEQVI